MYMTNLEKLKKYLVRVDEESHFQDETFLKSQISGKNARQLLDEGMFYGPANDKVRFIKMKDNACHTNAMSLAVKNKWKWLFGLALGDGETLDNTTLFINAPAVHPPTSI